MSACSSLEDIIIEPEMSDLQLTVDTLKTSLRDAQRMVDELRVEVDARGQELAEVQIARAQLEGRVQEAERRLTEARHVIDLQRTGGADQSRATESTEAASKATLESRETGEGRSLSRSDGFSKRRATRACDDRPSTGRPTGHSG
jgi:septal ring factor EnvC (AmiA/AmiB activator)